MQRLISRYFDVWHRNIHPQLSSFISFVGGLWLSICLLVAYLLAKLSNEVLEKEMFAFDTTILLSIHQTANPLLDACMVRITHIGDPRTVVPMTVGIVMFLGWRRDWVEAQFFSLNAFGGAILSYGLKLIFNKDRPRLWPQIISENTFSYPSGHALGSMVIYGFLAYLLASHYPRYRILFYAIAAGLMSLIGLSRLYLGVHWPTDIIAGFGIGFLWVVACINLMRLQQMKATAIE